MIKPLVMITITAQMCINCSTVIAETVNKRVQQVTQEPIEPKIVKKTPYTSPFGSYESFIEFMKGSKFAVPSWSDHELRVSFPKAIYESCLDPAQTQFLEVLYQSPNGITRGWTVRATGGNQKLPVVVFNRGGFARWGRIVPFELLSLCRVAKQGFMVIASDFRGIKESSEKQDKTDLGYGDVNDSYYLIDAVAKEYTDLDTDNIAVWGFSRGTSVAVKMATQSDSIRLLILQGMVTDLVNDQRRKEFDEHVYPLLVDGWEALPISEQNNLLSGISPSDLINKIRGKPSFLILHGAKDTRTSPQEALIYAGNLLKHNYTVEFHLYPNSGHVLSGSYNNYINKVISSLNQHMRLKP